MMILQAFGPAFGQPSPSPFCVKAMCLLTMAGVKWKPDFTADIRKAPRGKFPVLVDGDRTIPDSGEIQQHLETHHGADFDAGLSATERAHGHMMIRMADEHLYHACVYDRWFRDDNWAVLRDTYFAAMPWPLRAVVPGIVRKSALNNLRGQGIGRMTYDEMVARAEDDLCALDQVIGDAGFLFGDRPTAADASIGPLLAAIASGPNETPLRECVQKRPAMMAYVTRIETAIYPDMTGWKGAKR